LNTKTHTVGSERVDGVQREPGEDPSALVVGVGRGVDGAHRPHDLATALVLPPQEDAETGDAISVAATHAASYRTDSRGASREEPAVLLVGHPSRDAWSNSSTAASVGVAVIPYLQVPALWLTPAVCRSAPLGTRDAVAGNLWRSVPLWGAKWPKVGRRGGARDPSAAALSAVTISQAMRGFFR